MNLKYIASVVSLTMGMNSIALASPPSETHMPVNESLIDQSIDEQSAEMKETLAQINALITHLTAFRDANRKNRDSIPLNTLKTVISALGVTSGLAALRNTTPKTSAQLVTSAMGGFLSAVLEYSVGKNTIDIRVIQDLMQRTHKEIADAAILSSREISRDDRVLIAGILSQIGQINEQIAPSNSELQKQIGSGQTGLAVTSVLSWAVKYSAFFLSKKWKAILANKAPNLVLNGQKTAEITQKGGLWGLGISNLFPLVSAAVGMSGKPAEEQINMIISRLTEAKVKLVMGIQE